MDPDWAGLPKHILDLILGKLVSFVDYVRFGTVCHSWHSTMKDNIPVKQNKLLRQHQVPMLLFPDKEEDQWSIYNVMDNRFLNLKLSLSCNRRFNGFSEGWLVVGNENFTVTLHQPNFIAKEENSRVGRSIDLPCLFPPVQIEDIEDWDAEDLEDLHEFDDEYVNHIVKVLITADPLENPNNCTIFVILRGEHDHGIAFIRYSKDTTWIKIENYVNFDDILHYKSKVYALGYQGELVSFDSANPSIVKLITPDFPIFTCCRRYLVESNGELLQVERLLSVDDDLNRSTKMFRIYRMDFEETKWVEIKSLGGATLFIGDNTSISVLASDFNMCRPNCIYFTHDDIGINGCKGSDMGIYNVESGSFELHYNIDAATFFRIVNRPPIWVVPIPRV